MGLAAKILKASTEPADAFVCCFLVLHGDSSSNPEASCLSARLVILELDKQYACCPGKNLELVLRLISALRKTTLGLLQWLI